METQVILKQILFIINELNQEKMNIIEAYGDLFCILAQDMELDLYVKLLLHMCVCTILFVLCIVWVMTCFKNSIKAIGNMLYLATKVEKVRTL